MMTPKQIGRFWAKVDNGGMSDCWEWKAGKNKGGYGRFKTIGKDKIAHRVAYVLKNAEIPEGMCVLHRCDNPSCVNPAHLFLGTQAENLEDMDRKGRRRAAKGSSQGCSKLSEIDIPLIRLWIERGYTDTEIAKAYGVSQKTIWKISNGKTWSHTQ